VLMTEGIGPKNCHGRIVLLVNEHTVSAGEMITSFAAENKLATIVGTETAGCLLGGSGFKVGHGYLVILPKAVFYTWQGKSYEGRGVTPDVPVACSPEAALEGKARTISLRRRLRSLSRSDQAEVSQHPPPFRVHTQSVSAKRTAREGRAGIPSGRRYENSWACHSTLGPCTFLDGEFHSGLCGFSMLR
jgi:Peptidase family S41